MNVWEVVGGVAGGTAALCMFGLSIYDRIRARIASETRDTNDLAFHAKQLDAIQEQMTTWVGEMKAFREEFVAYRAEDRAEHKGILEAIDSLVRRIERQEGKANGRTELDVRKAGLK